MERGAQLGGKGLIAFRGRVRTNTTEVSTGCPTSGLVGWLVGRSVGRLAGWLVDYLVILRKAQQKKSGKLAAFRNKGITHAAYRNAYCITHAAYRM